MDPLVSDEIKLQLYALRNSESDIKKCRVRNSHSDVHWERMYHLSFDCLGVTSVYNKVGRKPTDVLK